MKKLLFVIMLVASFLMPPFSHAEESFGEFAAPGGVQWGQTKTQLQAAGVDVGGCSNRSNGHFSLCVATTLPKNLSFAKEYVLLFDDKSDRLVKLVIIGKDITMDYFGTQGKELYQKVNNAISKKYPEHVPDSYERIGMRLYDETDEFYECLRYGSKCGLYTTYFQPHKEKGGYIVVELKGIRAGKGYLKVSYESRLFYSLKGQYDQQDSEADEDAL